MAEDSEMFKGLKAFMFSPNQDQEVQEQNDVEKKRDLAGVWLKQSTFHTFKGPVFCKIHFTSVL